MKKEIIIILFLLAVCNTYGQQFIYMGTKSYKSVKSWGFKDNCEGKFSKVMITIGRHKIENTGVILIEVSYFF